MQHDTMNALTSNPTATVVAGATVTSGIGNWLDLINDGLGLVAVICGIVLTSILIKKHLFELRMMREKAQTRRKEDNGRAE